MNSWLVWGVEFPGMVTGQSHSGSSTSMIRVLEGNKIEVFSIESGKVKGKIISFTSTIDEIADI